jgi:o-succinylbenzoate synthase
MTYRFEFRPYQRQFTRSLLTSHGRWDIREGIILRLTDAMGSIGWGEIAPVPWFGSETLEQALELCQQLPQEITAETIFSIPSTLPACQFGFESALELEFWANLTHPQPQIQNNNTTTPSRVQLQKQSNPTRAKTFPAYEGRLCLYSDTLKGVGYLETKIPYSGLLPTGEAALAAWKNLWQQGYRTFKWKIGVASIEEELRIFAQLIQSLPNSAKLRLDANGGLSLAQAKVWLERCQDIPQVEFLEQPLSVEQFETMLELTHQYCTAIALDESVATIEQMEACYQLGWRGIFAIKPAIAGSPSRLRQFCQQQEIDAVFSSVFETPIGKQSALKLAAELSRLDRAIGFGVDSWFNNEDDAIYLENLWTNP